jgi:aminopeptidase
MKNSLEGTPLDPELAEGARNAIRVCLRVKPEETVTLITDESSKPIAASLANEIAAVGSSFHLFVLEELAPRPLKTMPQPVLDDLEICPVSIFAAQALPHELYSRMQMTEVVNRRKLRHAHMVNINKQIMMEGMRADFLQVDAISRRVWELASSARAIHATTAAGTDLRGEFSPSLKWLKTSGIISREKWGNLPGGEVFTAPKSVDGTLVVDGVVGDYLCSKFGNLRDAPLSVKIQNGRLQEAHSDNRELEDDFWRYTHTDENSDRVGEFAIGTNVALRHVIGHILQDEKLPGLHIAFGNPYGEHTGAQWYSSTHIDVVGTQFNVWIDSRQIMQEGQFLQPL